MIIPESEEKTSVKSTHRDEGKASSPSDQVSPTLPHQNHRSIDTAAQSPPPYSSLPEGSSTEPTQSSNLPPDLAPANYIHVREKDRAVKRKILLDLNVPRAPASALPLGAQGEDTPHLVLDAHNGSVSGEVWVLRANPEDATTARKPARERAHLYLHSHNGSVKAQVVRRLGIRVCALTDLFVSISIRRRQTLARSSASKSGHTMAQSRSRSRDPSAGS
jgi:hypothetical protein